MGLLIFGYLFVPVAFFVMLKHYQPRNWAWLAILIASIFIGVAPFVAIAYLFTVYESVKKDSKKAVVYAKDGTYTMYQAKDVQTAPDPGKTAFRIIGGLIAGAAIAFGLLIVGVVLLFTLAPSVACGGSSKCY